MKGSRAVLVLSALVLILGTASSWAQDDPFCRPLDEKMLSSGRITVKFDSRVYTFLTDANLSVRFEKFDAVRVKLTVKPLGTPKPTVTATVQWDYFDPVPLELNTGVDNSFILNTETGYAEK